MLCKAYSCQEKIPHVTVTLLHLVSLIVSFQAPGCHKLELQDLRHAGDLSMAVADYTCYWYSTISSCQPVNYLYLHLLALPLWVTA